MSDFFLRKDELEFMDRDLKRRGFSWDEINSRKTKLKIQLKELRGKLDKKVYLTPKERNLIFKEEFSRMITNYR